MNRVDQYTMYYNNLTEAEKVTTDSAPSTVVQELNEPLNSPATEYLGPSSVQNEPVPETEFSWESAVAEEVFLKENFDPRPDFDSALNVANVIDNEMMLPVTKVVPHNTPVDNDTKEIKAEEKAAIKADFDKKIKYGMAAVIAYLVFFKK